MPQNAFEVLERAREEDLKMQREIISSLDCAAYVLKKDMSKLCVIPKKETI